MAAEDPTARPLDEEALRREQQEMDEWMSRREEQEQSQPPETNLPPPPESIEKPTSTDAAEHALWETETTEHGFEIVPLTEENQAWARDYVIDRLEGAGIQVRGLKSMDMFEDHLAVEFRGEEATIIAPLHSSSWDLLRLYFLHEQPDPEHILVRLFFGPRSEDDDAFGPHVQSVIGTVGDIIALIQY